MRRKGKKSKGPDGDQIPLQYQVPGAITGQMGAVPPVPERKEYLAKGSQRIPRDHLIAQTASENLEAIIIMGSGDRALGATSH